MNNPESPEPSAQSQFLGHFADVGKMVDLGSGGRRAQELETTAGGSIEKWFHVSNRNVCLHLKSIFEKGELLQWSVVKNFFNTGAGGKKVERGLASKEKKSLKIPVSLGQYRRIKMGLSNVQVWKLELGKSQIEATDKESLSVRREGSCGIQRAIISGGEFEKAIQQLPAAPKPKIKGGEK
jgi:hypothetical protein